MNSITKGKSGVDSRFETYGTLADLIGYGGILAIMDDPEMVVNEGLVSHLNGSRPYGDDQTVPLD